jgi:hypothetical protein
MVSTCALLLRDCVRCGCRLARRVFVYSATFFSLVSHTKLIIVETEMGLGT